MGIRFLGVLLLCQIYCAAQKLPPRDLSFGQNGASLINLYDSIPKFGRCIDLDVDSAGASYALYSRSVEALNVASTLVEDNIIVKVKPSGTLDSSFGENGLRNVGLRVFDFRRSIFSNFGTSDFVRVSPDQKNVYVISHLLFDTAIVTWRGDTNGRTDSTYGINGYKQKKIHDVLLRDVAMTPDGGFIAIGMEQHTDSSIFIYKFKADGEFDPQFADAGTLNIKMSYYWVMANTTVFADGTILLSGFSGYATLIKITPEGKFAASFGDNGIAKLQYGSTNVVPSGEASGDYSFRTVVLSDSSIVLNVINLGSLNQYKFLKNGMADLSFGDNGGTNATRFNASGTDLIGRHLDPFDRNLWFLGQNWENQRQDLIVMQLNPDGTLDKTSEKHSPALIDLYNNGFTIATPTAVAVNNQLVSSFADRIGKFNPDGQIDSAYGRNGKGSVNYSCSVDELLSLRPLRDGRMIGVAGDMKERIFFRLTAHGDKDTSFHTNGILRTPGGFYTSVYWQNMLLDRKERIVYYSVIAAEPNNSFILLERFTSDGFADSTFGMNGGVELRVLPWLSHPIVAFDHEHKLLVFGAYVQPELKTFLLRLNEDGSIDTNFGGGGISRLNNNSVGEQMIVLKDSSIVVSIRAHPSLALLKFDKDGRFFAQNTSDRGDEAYNFLLSETEDGKIMVAQASFRNGSVARHNQDLTYDSTYRHVSLTAADLGSEQFRLSQGHIMSNGRLILGGVGFRYISASPMGYMRYGLMLVGFKPEGGRDSIFGVNGVVGFNDLLPDTLNETLPFGEVNIFGIQDHPRISMFRDKDGQLITAATVKRNRLSDIFVTRNLIYDTLPLGNLTIWTRKFCAGESKIIVRLNGRIDTLRNTLSASPSCNEGNAITYTLRAGNYELTAYCGNDSVTYQVRIFGDSCIKREIAFPSPHLGRVVFWSRSMCASSNSIQIVFNQSLDSLRQARSVEPACNLQSDHSYELPPGTYAVTAYCGNDSLKTTVSIVANACVTKEISFQDTPQESVRAFPNPTPGLITLVLNEPDKGIVNILDLTGRIMQTQVFSGDRISIDLSSLMDGMYIVEVKGDKIKSRVRVMKWR
jgi:uncharacterized delta-60 repeat protein